MQTGMQHHGVQISAPKVRIDCICGPGGKRVTAEIAVMNQSAVALAADSAATRSGAKIFAANKIFALSKFSPVAVMVYGSASCLYVPWETIIKEYRAELGERSHPTVEAYSQDFLRFMSASSSLFPKSEQEKFAAALASTRFRDIRSQITGEVERALEKPTPLESREIRRIVRDVITERRDRWRSFEMSVGLPKGFYARLRTRYREQIEQAITEVFERLPLTKANRDYLVEIALSSWCKGPQTGLSGLVFAGFGDENIFPSVVSYELDGVLLDHPISWRTTARTMGHDDAAVIVPFAQQDMIRLFVEGVTPRYEEFIEAYFAKVTAGLGADGREKLLATLRSDLLDQRRELYIDPLLSIVGSLPMDELASLAESLVNLTSLRRRVSLDE
jgi:hypothetical protein